MKKANWILVLSVLCLTAIACSKDTAQNSAEKNETARLSVSGTGIVNAKGEKVVLSGVSLAWHNWWGRFFNASAVKTFKNDWKATVIRAAMGVEPAGSYLSNPQEAMEKMTTVIDAAIDNEVYVIIDWHSHGIQTQAAKDFFAQMATRYKDSPYIIYEIFNEPEYDSWEAVKAYSLEIIETIRAIDTENIILVGTPHWGQDVHLAADNPIQGYKNIMYTLHFYAGTHKQELRERANYALSKGLPIFVSECASMNADGDGYLDMEEWQKWRNWMTENSISWVAWAIADKYESCSMILPDASSQGPWNDTDLKEWGRIVKKELLQK